MIIHIVSGYSACATLKYALHNLVQPKENSNSIIINHFDDLSIGPLCDIDTTNATIRAEFWEKILCHNVEADLLQLYNDLNKLKVLNAANAKVILWYGYNATEILTTRRIAWYLHNNINIKTEEVILSSKYFKDTSRQNSISMLSPKELSELYKKSRSMNSRTLTSWAQEWEIIGSTPNCIRIWRNNALEMVPTTFFDNNLLDLIDNNWVLSTKVVGEVMGTSYFLIGDTWLFSRLQYFIDIKILETQPLPINLQKMHPPKTIYIRRIK